ncbi:hypothetical protein [Ramlibacter algicola]|uniref:Uncharacterized protein n=1 Tax=Ramlibacter algicola TaxID=2795217 RepID=A0A934Q0F8_9BURK|nr:hypothetical protein [Ramlibacter algicola]MBK0392024.1 hypothetical protein [Ramlibacter algicola]
MALEIPSLRIGLIGFSQQQQDALHESLNEDTATRQAWEFAPAQEADALWINGARTQLLPEGLLRVASGIPSGRSTQLDPSSLNRPAAYAAPLPRAFQPDIVFNLDPGSVAGVLRKFEQLLRPQIAQFCLASQILEQESALGSGVYRVERPRDGALIAVVDLRGDVGVFTSASAVDFDNAMWTALAQRTPDQIPAHFFRCSLSRLMWEYALRTTRDVLPRRYRSDMLYFRRPPRLPQRLLQDSHLLLLRELATAPGTMPELQDRTGIEASRIAADLGALYLVGAITSNPKRAAPIASLPSEEEIGSSTHSVMPASRHDDSHLPPILRQRGSRSDRTAPAPLQLDQ